MNRQRAARRWTRAPASLALPLLAWLALCPAAAADETKGRDLLRQARAALDSNDPQKALEFAQGARTEWPGSALVDNTLADIQARLLAWDDAIKSYTEGLAGGEYPLHSYFNRGVAQHARAEDALAKAAVPADPDALPQGPQPEMLKAIKEHGLKDLGAAREDFLSALDLPESARDAVASGAARESVGALNRRVDALQRIVEELEHREQEQQQQQKQDDKDKDKDKNQKDKDNKDQQDQQGEQDQKDQQQDQKDKDGQQDQQDKSGDQDKQQQPSPDKQPGQEQDQKQGQPPPEGSLSKEQVQQILDKLAELEQEGRELQKSREAAAKHRPVEKDW